MTDIMGPVVLIALIFAVYWISQNLDTLGQRKLLTEETRKIEAETKLRAEEVKMFDLRLEMEKLMDKPQLPNGIDVEYEVLEDKSEDPE